MTISSLPLTDAPPTWVAADWQALRTAGLAYVEQVARANWTDYNRHDPGVTLLELLCYAITDLSQRTSLDVKDLLRSGFASDADMARAFPGATQVLPTTPVTELDYRKLLLDVPGVRNAWLHAHPVPVGVRPPEAAAYADPQNHSPAAFTQLSYPGAGPRPALAFDLRGLYDITVDLDPLYVSSFTEAYNKENPRRPAPLTEAQARAVLLERVRDAYQRQRNLGEDCLDVKQLPVQRLLVCADVDLVPGANVRAVHAQLLLAFDQYLAPPIRRYSLAELQALTDANGQSLTIDQLLEGPLPAHGFIRDEDLLASTLRDTVYASDLVALAMAVPGVAAIRDLRLSALVHINQSGVFYDYSGITGDGLPVDDPDTYLDPGSGLPYFQLVVDPRTAGQAWQLSVRPGARAQLDPERTMLNFYQGILPVSSAAEKQQAINQFKLLQAEASRSLVRSLADDPLPVPVGTPHALAAYQPLALDLPANYGVGPAGLPPDAPLERRNQARQLRAYLLFFDQLLANYLSQLTHAAALFGPDAAQTATYFGQALGEADLPGLAELYGRPDALHELGVASPTTEALAASRARKGRFLDHLLARFAENFAEYGLLMYSLDGQRASPEVLSDKAALAADLGRFHPARGYYYALPSWQGVAAPVPAWPGEPDPGPNVAGIVRRFGRLAGLADFEPRATATQQPGVRLRRLDAKVPGGNGPAGSGLGASKPGEVGNPSEVVSGQPGTVVNIEFGEVGTSQPGEPAGASPVVNVPGEVVVSVPGEVVITKPGEVVISLPSDPTEASPVSSIPSEPVITKPGGVVVVVPYDPADASPVNQVPTPGAGEQAGASRYFFELLDPIDATQVLAASEPVPYASAAAAHAAVVAAARAALAQVRQRDAWHPADPPAQGPRRDFRYELRAGATVLARTPDAGSDPAAEAYLNRLLRRLQTADETIYVVEHLLLRPDPAAADQPQWLSACAEPDGTYCEPLDPYSYRVSIVLPGYTARFRNVDYRRYAERLLRLELPAHVLARICWVNQADLHDFEQAYRAWLDQQTLWATRTVPPAVAPTVDFEPADFNPYDFVAREFRLADYAKAQQGLVEVLNKLHTTYSGGTLYDCENPDALDPLVLGRSVLGQPPTADADNPTTYLDDLKFEWAGTFDE